MNHDDDLWKDRFHLCSLIAGRIAHAEGRLADSEYVRKLAYDFFESGAFRDTQPAT
jgi:hypothetical protein